MFDDRRCEEVAAMKALEKGEGKEDAMGRVFLVGGSVTIWR